MPTLVDPWTATRLTWPARRQGQVIIKGTISDSLLLGGFPFRFQLTVKFKRDHWDQALQWWKEITHREKAFRQFLGRTPAPEALTAICWCFAGSIVNALANIAYWYHLDARDLSQYRKQELIFRYPPDPFFNHLVFCTATKHSEHFIKAINYRFFYIIAQKSSLKKCATCSMAVHKSRGYARRPGDR